ncbi:MAG: ABC transporter ATP-binding protein [Desulfovibrionaceae bacterium]|jgi:ATP-binding cassette subfamily C protein|nr:ABC transporter ATP-binding protein [Desulfovibrionaceae bacterium]
MHLKRSLSCFLYFFRLQPLGTIFMLCAQFLSSMLEGLGILSLLPILSLATGNVSESSRLHETVSAVLGLFGLAPTLPVLLGFIITMMILKSLLAFLAMLQVGYAVAGASTQLRRRLVKVLMHTRWSYFTRLPVGIVSNAMSYESVTAANAYWSFCQAAAIAFQLLFYAIASLLISPLIVAISVAAGAISMLAVNAFVGMARTAGDRQAELMKTISARFSDGITGIKALKAMAAEDRFTPLLERDNDRLNVALRNYVFSRGAISTFQEPLLVVFVAALMYVALNSMHMAFSELMVLIFLFHRLVTRFSGIQLAYQNMAATEGAFWSLHATMEEAQASREEQTGGAAPRFTSGIALRGVTKSYDATALYRDLDLDIPAKGLTVLTGPSGSGKTTLIDLVIGLIPPDAGEILVDGTSLRDIDVKAWRSAIGYVPQELFLFNDTVRNNLTLHDDGIADERILEALRMAGADTFIAGLDRGLETPVGERGGMLSGGQRQRLAIARALLRSPRLLILDEATSSLDADTERAICATIKEVSAAIPVLAISHRLELTKRADTVYTLTPDPEKGTRLCKGTLQ